MVMLELPGITLMKIAVFSARPYDQQFLDEASQRRGAGQPFEFL